VYPVSPLIGPGSAKSVWELSPDPEMVAHLMPNKPISVTTQQSQNKSSQNSKRNCPDDDVYTDEATSGQRLTNKTKRVFELLRAGYEFYS
jgi:mevalonate pyrophosphate decarboxylase